VAWVSKSSESEYGNGIVELKATQRKKNERVATVSRELV
jgi:hypothetical protein